MKNVLSVIALAQENVPRTGLKVVSLHAKALISLISLMVMVALICAQKEQLKRVEFVDVQHNVNGVM